MPLPPGPLLPTPMHYFYRWEREKAQAPFLYQPYGRKWHIRTWAQAGKEARQIASALQALGVERGSLVGLISKNCSHWILADLAIQMVGAVSVPFYANIAPADLALIIEKSGITHLFVGKLDPGYWAKAREAIPSSVQLIRFPDYPASDQIREGLAWEALLEAHPPLQEAYEPKEEDLWTILYTSGTTGTPKGVMLSYRCPAALFRHEATYREIGIFDLSEPRFFSYLPLNHIAERMAIELACFYLGGTIAFAESLETFARNLQDVQPTFFFAVPRIWQRFRLAVLERFGESRYNRLIRLPLLGPLVKRFIRYKLGLGKVEVALTGAALTPEPVKAWFHELGVFVREVYAMTENCAGCTIMPRNYHKPYTVGKPLTGVRLKIDPETQEILMWADWVMDGYYKEPEKTAEVLRDGWLHTGDMGELDEEGFLRVTGRVSDAFKTAKGMFVVPGPLEEPFSKLPYAEQVCVVGMGQTQPFVLISLSEIGRKESPPTVTEAVAQLIQQVNAQLPPYQRLARAILLSDTWSVENGLLTPTLKVRRRQIEAKYSPLYEKWLSHPETVIWA